MSPVSRGRRTRNSKKGNKSRKGARGSGLPTGQPGTGKASPAAPPGTAFRTLVDLLGGPRKRPEWFDPSIDAVLDQAETLMSTVGPRELEQQVARLLGAELHRSVQAGRSGLWFDWWFGELAEAAATRARKELGACDRGRWQECWRLLHALTTLGSPALARDARARLDEVAGALPGDIAATQPRWLWHTSKVAATGELWQVRDGYGGRLAVIAGFCYGEGVDRHVFLFDVDACGFVTLAGAGVFDTVEDAAVMWRTQVGDTAQQAEPVPVESPEDLHCLVHWDQGEETVRGDEPRPVMDNWFRARRRLHDLAGFLEQRGTPLPDPKNLYRDLDTAPVVDGFTTWLTGRHGEAPDPQVVEVLTREWLAGALPGTGHLVAPDRVRFFLSLMNDDWVPDDPLTIAVRALLPEWVRWHGEQAGLPTHLLGRAVAAAAGTCGNPQGGVL